MYNKFSLEFVRSEIGSVNQAWLTPGTGAFWQILDMIEAGKLDAVISKVAPGGGKIGKHWASAFSGPVGKTTSVYKHLIDEMSNGRNDWTLDFEIDGPTRTAELLMIPVNSVGDGSILRAFDYVFRASNKTTKEFSIESLAAFMVWAFSQTDSASLNAVQFTIGEVGIPITYTEDDYEMIDASSIDRKFKDYLRIVRITDRIEYDDNNKPINPWKDEDYNY